jgi:hypothetical protein
MSMVALTLPTQKYVAASSVSLTRLQVMFRVLQDLKPPTHPHAADGCFWVLDAAASNVQNVQLPLDSLLSQSVPDLFFASSLSSG